MQIRRLVPADAAPFQALRLQALLEAPAAFGASYENEQGTPLSQIESQLAAESGRLLFGAFVGDELVAIAGIGREGGPKEAHKGYVRSFYVTPNQRGQGVGRAVLAHLLAYARTLPGLRQLTLAVNAANKPAIALYNSLGFTRYGVEPDSQLVAGHFHDEMLMFLVL